MAKKEYIGQRLGLHCPFCRSNKLTKDGKKVKKRCKVQRYLCHNCWRYTVEPKNEK